MELERIHFRTQLRFLLDSLLIILCFYLSYYIRKPFTEGPFHALGPLEDYVWLLIVSLPFWWLILIVCGVYSATYDDTGTMLRSIGKASLFMLFSLSLLFFLFSVSEVNRSFVVLFTFLSSVSMALWRWMDARYSNTLETKRLLIVGQGSRLEIALEKVTNDPFHRYVLVGVLSDDPQVEVKQACILGHTEQLYEVLHAEVVDEVLFSLSFSDLESRGHLLEICRLLGINGLVLVEERWIGESKLDVGKMFGLPFLYLTTVSVNEVDLWAKELVDRTVGLILLIFLSPLLFLIAAFIKVTSSGPVLFVQQRSGKNGRKFRMYKFRTMIADAPFRKQEIQHLNEMSGPVFKLKNDPRITVVGRFLRKYSLDELAQLLNVVKGDMSLVGPRPLPVEEAAQIKEAHRRRLSVKPGMTCIWQISGRNQISYEEWMKLDLQYIDNWSLGLDFKILLKTPAAVFSSRGAH